MKNKKDDIIQPIDETISIADHLEFLKTIQRVQNNFINKKSRNKNNFEIENLNRIERSIQYFQNINK